MEQLIRMLLRLGNAGAAVNARRELDTRTAELRQVDLLEARLDAIAPLRQTA